MVHLPAVGAITSSAPCSSAGPDPAHPSATEEPRGGRLPASPPAVRLIAFDIDGTLMPSTGPMAERTRAALMATAAAGFEVVIATGRRQAYAAPLLTPVGLAPETILISSNGTVTRDFAGHTFDRSFLPVNVARDLCAVLRPFGGTTVYTFDREGKGELVIESLERLHERVSAWVTANLPWIEQIDPLERAFDGNEAPIQGMVCGTVQEMTRAEQHLLATPYAKLIEMHRTEYAARDLSILDILPRGCSKGVALAKLAERKGIPRAEVMAIGDNWNDLEMLRWAGQPVLMGNASPELQAIAVAEGWEITASNDECGVALVLERLLAEQGRPQPGSSEVSGLPARSGVESRSENGSVDHRADQSGHNLQSRPRSGLATPVAETIGRPTVECVTG